MGSIKNYLNNSYLKPVKGDAKMKRHIATLIALILFISYGSFAVAAEALSMAQAVFYVS